MEFYLEDDPEEGKKNQSDPAPWPVTPLKWPVSTPLLLL